MDVVALNNIEDVINDFRRKNTGVILITHSEEMLELADRAILVCQGQLLKKGSTREISDYFKNECVPCEDEDAAKYNEVSQVG